MNDDQFGRLKRIIEEAYERHATNNYDSPDGVAIQSAMILLAAHERMRWVATSARNEFQIAFDDWTDGTISQDELVTRVANALTNLTVLLNPSSSRRGE